MKKKTLQKITLMKATVVNRSSKFIDRFRENKAGLLREYTGTF